MNYEVAIEKLNIPKDVAYNSSIIHITGKYEISVENYRKILFCNEEIIKIQAKNFVVIINGIGLVLSYLGKDDIKITGKLINIEFCNHI